MFGDRDTTVPAGSADQKRRPAHVEVFLANHSLIRTYRTHSLPIVRAGTTSTLGADWATIRRSVRNFHGGCASPCQTPIAFALTLPFPVIIAASTPREG